MVGSGEKFSNLRFTDAWKMLQSLLQGPPCLGPEEDFQIRGLQIPGKCYSGTIL